MSTCPLAKNTKSRLLFENCQRNRQKELIEHVLVAREDVEVGEDGALLTIKEVAALLGLSSTRMYVRVAQGFLPGVVRIGARIYLKRAVLERWLTSDDDANILNNDFRSK